MLSFELSAMDLILTIAIVVLLALYVTKASAKPPRKPKTVVVERPTENLAETDTNLMKVDGRLPTQTQTDSPRCPHGIKLAKLDNREQIPDKCLSCTRIMECYSSNE